jgi:hypothetical protein
MKVQRRNVYAVFIDVSKAYDRVSMTGLWAKLIKYKIRGKLWRVLREIYRQASSCVRFDEWLSDFFATPEGLRQGCKLSTDLFSLFIADLVRVMKSLQIGVNLNTLLQICILLFADDILLLAESREDMQSLVWKLDDWFFQHRLTINHSKSGLMRFHFGDADINDEPVYFGGSAIPVVEKYKYCGVWFTEDFSSTEMQTEVLKKVNSRLDRELKYSVYNTHSHETRIIVWNQLIRCLFEYFYCIWGEDEWADGEHVFYRAAKVILGFPVGTTVTTASALGELGWMSLQGRLYLLRLRFFRKLLCTSSDRLLFQVFLHSQEAYHQNLRESQPRENRSFYAHLVDTLMKLGVPHLTTIISSPYDARLKESKTDWMDLVRNYEQKKWWTKVQDSPKLDTYKLVKTDLVPELYLKHNPLLTHLLTRLRLSQHYLFIETGRYHRPPVPRAERRCVLCSSGEVEDELHFLRTCLAHTDIRTVAFNKVLSISEGGFDLWNMSNLDFLRFVLSGSYSYAHPLNFTLCNVMLFFVQKMFNHRRMLFERRGLDPKQFHSR